MPTNGGAPEFLAGPFVAFAIIGVFVLVLRWAYSGRRDSLLSRRTRKGAPTDYGLLVPIATPSGPEAGERAREVLAAAGIRGTVAPTEAGLRVLVFPTDVDRARRILQDS